MACRAGQEKKWHHLFLDQTSPWMPIKGKRSICWQDPPPLQKNRQVRYMTCRLECWHRSEKEKGFSSLPAFITHVAKISPLCKTIQHVTGCEAARRQISKTRSTLIPDMWSDVSQRISSVFSPFRVRAQIQHRFASFYFGRGPVGGRGSYLIESIRGMGGRYDINVALGLKVMPEWRRLGQDYTDTGTDTFLQINGRTTLTWHSVSFHSQASYIIFIRYLPINLLFISWFLATIFFKYLTCGFVRFPNNRVQLFQTTLKCSWSPPSLVYTGLTGLKNKSPYKPVGILQ